MEVLGITSKHVERLKRRFDQIDIDKSGSIDRDELFLTINEKESIITEKLFRLIDIDKSGSIEFEEFVRICVTYCIYNKRDILQFCFDCFDKDASGFLEEDEYIGKIMDSNINSNESSYDIKNSIFMKGYTIEKVLQK